MEYLKFLEEKKISVLSSGFNVAKENLNPKLFDFQRDITRWNLKKGKSATWANCGLGKTPMQLEAGKQVYQHTKENVLLVAPLAVSHQTVLESIKFDIETNICRTQADVSPGINITNYEMLHHFNPDKFGCVILDEASILKSFDGKYRNMIIDMFRDTPYKFEYTATPAPNDYMEIGNHAEFLGVMSRAEMLATFFVHDSGDTAKWRLKGHAEDKFWEWVASWAVVLQKPSDLGYSDEGFELPPLNVHEIVVKSPESPYSLITDVAKTLQERRKARYESLELRVKKAAEIANDINEQIIVWCDLNAESEALRKAIPDAVEVKGSDSTEHKIKAAVDFAKGNIKTIVSKPSIFGWGLNWQSCGNEIFTGLSDSYEQYYQAVRRCWRFGQEKEVNVYIVISEAEGAVKANIERKEKDSERMIAEMVKYTQKILTEEIHGTARETIDYNPQVEMILPDWLGVEN